MVYLVLNSNNYNDKYIISISYLVITVYVPVNVWQLVIC